mgnify:CR=1 FL=1
MRYPPAILDEIRRQDFMPRRLRSKANALRHTPGDAHRVWRALPNLRARMLWLLRPARIGLASQTLDEGLREQAAALAPLRVRAGGEYGEEKR